MFSLWESLSKKCSNVLINFSVVNQQHAILQSVKYDAFWKFCTIKYAIQFIPATRFCPVTFPFWKNIFSEPPSLRTNEKLTFMQAIRIKLVNLRDQGGADPSPVLTPHSPKPTYTPKKGTFSGVHI